MKLRIVFFLAALTLAVAGPAIPASAATPRCGSVITADVTFTSDLTCAGTALRVMAAPNPAVHINLNGHTLRGNGTGTGIEVDGPATGKTALSVTGGTVSGFASAFAVGNSDLQVSPSLAIDHLTLRNNGSWLYYYRYLLFSSATVQNSTIIDSGSGGTRGSGTLTARNTTLVRSTVAMGDEPNLFLSGNTFISGGASTGLNAYIIASGNTFVGCDVGISASDTFTSPASTIQGNTFAGCRVGLDLHGFSGGIAVTKNTFLANREIGFRLGAENGSVMQISGNRFLGNGGDGLAGSGPKEVVVSGNTAIGNGGHGINLSPLTRGTVVSPVTDGGGDVGYGNRTPPDCVGVACRAH